MLRQSLDESDSISDAQSRRSTCKLRAQNQSTKYGHGTQFRHMRALLGPTQIPMFNAPSNQGRGMRTCFRTVIKMYHSCLRQYDTKNERRQTTNDERRRTTNPLLYLMLHKQLRRTLPQLSFSGRLNDTGWLTSGLSHSHSHNSHSHSQSVADCVNWRER